MDGSDVERIRGREETRIEAESAVGPQTAAWRKVLWGKRLRQRLWLATLDSKEKAMWILVFVCVNLHAWWSKTLAIDCLAGSCETAPQSRMLCYRGRRWRHFAEERHRQGRSWKEAAWWFSSPGVENLCPNYISYASHWESGLESFCELSVQDDTVRSSSSKRPSLGTQLSARIKGGIILPLILSPCLC